MTQNITTATDTTSTNLMTTSVPTIVDGRLVVNRLFSLKFWDAVGVKVVESMVSVKVWGLIATMGFSTWLLINGHITGDNWTTVNGTVFGIIYGMREAFKIQKIKEMFNTIQTKE